MNTIIIKRKLELFSLISRLTLSVNDRKSEFINNKTLSTPDGTYNLCIEDSFARSNNLIIKVKGDETTTIYVEGTKMGRHGRVLSIATIVSSLLFIILEHLFKSPYSLHFLLPFFAYMLMPAYTSVFERNKNRIMLYTRK